MKQSQRDVFQCLISSPPTRGAWIETLQPNHTASLVAVAPHAGGVD